MSSKKFNLGILGFGGIGEQHYLNFREFSRDISVGAVCDQNEKRLGKAQYDFQIPYQTQSVEEFFNLPLQAVVIATPNVTHYPLVKRALLQGWHVLCEKPFTMEAWQAEELHHLAESRGLVNMVAFSYRFIPAAKMLRELLQKGQAGTIYHVRC
ncbi:MAG: Gfo/Idh/MocA family protein, partial [bacterium]